MRADTCFMTMSSVHQAQNRVYVPWPIPVWAKSRIMHNDFVKLFLCSPADPWNEMGLYRNNTHEIQDSIPGVVNNVGKYVHVYAAFEKLSKKRRRTALRHSFHLRNLEPSPSLRWR